MLSISLVPHISSVSFIKDDGKIEVSYAVVGAIPGIPPLLIKLQESAVIPKSMKHFSLSL